jgi:hypothetical protein
MTNRRRPITAEELDRQLAVDLEYQARIQALDLERERRWAIWRKDAEPVGADLRKAGLDVTSPWDLLTYSKEYPEAIPILLDHLNRDYLDRTREGIVRALSVKFAYESWPFLIEHYKRARHGISSDGIVLGVKDALANALAIHMSKENIDSIIDLLLDRRHGKSRAFLLMAIRTRFSKRLAEVVDRLGEDPEINHEILRCLTKLKRRLN